MYWPQYLQQTPAATSVFHQVKQAFSIKAVHPGLIKAGLLLFLYLVLALFVNQHTGNTIKHRKSYMYILFLEQVFITGIFFITVKGEITPIGLTSFPPCTCSHWRLSVNNNKQSFFPKTHINETLKFLLIIIKIVFSEENYVPPTI